MKEGLWSSMARSTIALALVLFLALPATASFIEDSTGQTYQEDAGVAGDAPATCQLATAARTIDLNEPAKAGMLVDYDDESDAYTLALGSSEVGQRISLSLLKGLAVSRHDIAFDVFAPGCGSSVLDPESPYYPKAPANPYTPGVGKSAYEGRTTGYDCKPSDWKFHANKIYTGNAPADVYVEWSNGQHEYVPLQKASQGTVAMYESTSNLGYTVARMVIVLPAGWQGDFKIAHGPCDGVVGDPNANAPVSYGSYAEFTAQQAGPHIVVVHIARGAVEKTTDTVLGIVANPPTTVPVHCHDICTLALQFASYDLGSSAVTA